MTTAFMKAVGRQVFFARTWQGLSQRKLESLCRVDQTTISRLERGLAPGLRLERLAAIMAVAEQCVPPTINYRDPDPECNLWVLSEATPMKVRYALSNNIGLGGHNGAVIFRRYEGD